MTKSELLKLIKNLPDKSEIFICHKEDEAYPATFKAFEEKDGLFIYFEIDRTNLNKGRSYPVSLKEICLD